MATATEAPAVTWRTAGDLLEALGEIATSRVRLQPPPGTATEADLITANERKQGSSS